MLCMGTVWCQHSTVHRGDQYMNWDHCDANTVEFCVFYTAHAHTKNYLFKPNQVFPYNLVQLGLGWYFASFKLFICLLIWKLLYFISTGSWVKKGQLHDYHYCQFYKQNKIECKLTWIIYWFVFLKAIFCKCFKGETFRFFVYLFVCLSICLFIYLFVYFCVYLP